MSDDDSFDEQVSLKPIIFNWINARRCVYFLHVFNILQSSNDGNNSELDLEEGEEEEENSSDPDEVIKHYIKNERN